MAKRLIRLKAFPWAVLFEAGLIVRGRWRALSKRDRAQLVDLARRSHGWPGNLTPKERAELRRLILRIDIRGTAGELIALRRAARKAGRARVGHTASALRYISTFPRRGR